MTLEENYPSILGIAQLGNVMLASVIQLAPRAAAGAGVVKPVGAGSGGTVQK